jgi:uncharacterized protein (UPF0254 family)
MIRIATAECFTHGRVGREIHAFSRGYPSGYAWTLDPKDYRVSLVAGLFIPTLSGVRSVLGIEPLPPKETLDDIKVYDQASDKVMALKMAEAVKGITGSHIGIGTTAGIGTGGIALVTDKIRLLAGSEVYADLLTSNPALIMKRQESGVHAALRMLEGLLGDENSTLPGGGRVTVLRPATSGDTFPKPFSVRAKRAIRLPRSYGVRNKPFPERWKIHR